MGQAIVFPDAAATFIDFLSTKISPQVTGTVPNTRPPTFVTVQRLGGVRRNLVIDEPQLSFECWGSTPEEAHDLAQLTRAHVLSLSGGSFAGVEFYRFRELAGPGDLPDPLSEQPRFVFSIATGVRGTPL
jgi:hypothetical protein